MTIKLHPCPFCNGEAEVERVGNSRQSHIINCNWCGCRLESNETFNQGSQWNKRPIEDEQLKVLKELYTWVQNWDPTFIADDEWPETESKVKKALGLK